MGTFLISPLRGQKGTDLLQVCPLLLGNEECPHFSSGVRSSEATGLHICKNGCAEMQHSGPYCFLLAALHSVAERVNPRKARPPAPHLSSRASERSRSPFTAAERKSRETRWWWSAPRGP